MPHKVLQSASSPTSLVYICWQGSACAPIRTQTSKLCKKPPGRLRRSGLATNFPACQQAQQVQQLLQQQQHQQQQTAATAAALHVGSVVVFVDIRSRKAALGDVLDHFTNGLPPRCLSGPIATSGSALEEQRGHATAAAGVAVCRFVPFEEHIKDHLYLPCLPPRDVQIQLFRC